MSESLSDIELGDIPALTWSLLQAGVESAAHPFHTTCLATLTAAGPTQRTVVLRHVDATSRMLLCHTDVRSAKVDQIHEDPRASWLFYDSAMKLQLRFTGTLTLHADDVLADSRWASTTATSRACYNTDIEPGRFLKAPAAAPPITRDEAALTQAKRHFAVVACRVKTLDWLFLDRAGHRRAQFRWSDDDLAAHWVAP